MFNLIIKIDVSKGLLILHFLKGYTPPGYNECASAKSRQVFKLRIYLSTDKVFKSRFSAMAIILSMDMIYSTM